MSVVVFGINHRTAPLEIRETLWLSSDEVRSVITDFKAHYFSECFLVSTCNRTELYGVIDEKVTPSPAHVLAELQKRFLTMKAVSVVREENIYLLQEYHAIHHLFKVASGVDSMVVGDIQILSQVKDAFAISTELKTTGMLLNRLLQATLHVAKRVRSETTITEGAVSVSYAAIELASKIFSDLSSKSALLIGAGETGELTAKHLIGKGIGTLSITNRTRSKADELAATLGGTVVDFESFLPTLSHVDIVVSSINTPNYIITKDHIRKVMKERSYRPLFIFDIGVPRNIDPHANEIDSVFVHDLDSIAKIVDQNLQKRKNELPKVNSIILDELKEFHGWRTSLQVNPTIQDLRQYFESVRNEEVLKNINRFSPENRGLVELVTKRIVNKLLHTPTTQLRNGHDDTAELKTVKLQFIRELFGLHQSRSPNDTKENE